MLASDFGERGSKESVSLRVLEGECDRKDLSAVEIDVELGDQYLSGERGGAVEVFGRGESALFRNR